MQSPQNRALELFNQALKQSVYLSYEMQKHESKAIVYNNLQAIKQCLFEVSQKTGLTKQLKEMYIYYEEVKKNIDIIQMEKKNKRKFVIIAKTSSGNFVKFRTNNIEKTIIFLNDKHQIYFANIFSNTGQNKGMLVYTYGKKKGIETAH